MDTLQKAVLIAHTLIALLIIALVLLQRGKGADAGAAFGAGASGTVFGARGSGSFFSRATAICATAFFVTSLSLAYLSSQNTNAPSSVIDDAPAIDNVMPMTDDEMPAMESDEVPVNDATDMPSLEESADPAENEGSE